MWDIGGESKRKGENMQEEIRKYRRKQQYLLAGIVILNLMMIIGMVIYYTLKQQALVGAVYQSDKSAGRQMVNEMFHLKIGGGNLEAARNAAWQAGYTENGFGYLPKLTGELTVVVGIVILMLVILGIGLWRISSIGKSDLPGKMLSLEQENARLQKELKLEHTYNENQKKQLQDFIENIAHQVKTPLTALTVKLGLLKEVSGKSQDETEAGLNSEGGKEEDNIPSKSHEQGDQLLGDCFYNVFKIKDFITRLLNISRLESGKVIMAEDEGSLEALLQESINGSGIDEERIVMDRNESETPTKDTILYADEGWLIEAFVNLISNCEDYIRENPEGRIFIDTEQTKESVTVVISDNGMGLKESDIPHIFNRFETTRDSRDFHVGIGLNLSKLIIDSHHGKIHAGNSEEHGGAEFRVMLPIYHMKSKVDMQSVL